MKTSIFSLLPVLALAIPLALTSCADSDDSEEPNPGGPVGGAVVDYNINDYQIKVDSKVYEPITAANWREQGSIFLYFNFAV